MNSSVYPVARGQGLPIARDAVLPLRHWAYRDPCTGLPNAGWLEERLALKIRRSREDGRPFCVAVIELLNLDRIRDALGPDAVQPALAAAAERLRKRLRAGETLACVNGVQFVVLSADTGPGFARSVGQWLTALSQPVQSLGKAVGLTVGAGLCPGDGHADAAALLLRAGLALAAVREMGGGGLRWFEPGMRQRALQRLELEQMLRVGLSRRQYRLMYQPQVHLASGEVRLMEALVRWDHPVRGPVSPAEFIPVAEDSGFIVELGAWILEQACRQASELLRKVGRSPVVSVNVSPLQVRQGDLLTQVERCLAAHELDPRYLELEITEGVLLDDGDAAWRTLSGLRTMGVKIAIDDFGTGYSSLSYLTRMPVDRLKIDRSFIVGMRHDDKHAAIVRAIIAMAHALGIAVTAEGVETREQADLLRTLGCDEVQGYWFSRPLAAEALAHVLGPL